MQDIRASFVIVNANTPEMKAFFNGVEITGIQDLKMDWDTKSPKVSITLDETDLVQEMKASGISVRRAV